MNRPLVGVGVFIKRDGKYLLGKRKGAHGAGQWSLPGGHLEGGESFEGCCIREVKEETGLDISNVKPLTFTNDIFQDIGKHYVTLFFSCDCAKGEPVNVEPDKCDGWGWFCIDDDGLPKPLFPPLEHLFEQI